MTRDEIERRFDALQQELTALRWEMLRQIGVPVLPGIGPLGAFADDPTFEEAARLGREYRDQVNRESLAELDRQEAAERAGGPAHPPAPAEPAPHAHP